MMVRDEFSQVPAANALQDASDAELQGLVERIVREELQQILASSGRMDSAPAPSEVFTIMQWLAPFIRDTIVDAIRLGVSLNGGATPHAAGDETGDLPGASELPPLADFAAAFTAARSRELDRTAGGDEAAADLDETSSDGASEGTAPTLLSGHVTLLVSPFEGFAEVQRFLHDVARIPRVFDVKPKRFTGGRLYVTFGTEHGDTQALADVLAADLAAYRPVLRSVQSDFLEILLRPSE